MQNGGIWGQWKNISKKRERKLEREWEKTERGREREKGETRRNRGKEP